MLSPTRNVNQEPTVKCKFCATDISFSAVAEHVCSQSNHLTQPQPYHDYSHEQYYEQTSTDTLARNHRPVLPKLDSSLAGRSGLKPYEAASIAHDLGLPSPLSAGAPGHRSAHGSRSRSRSRKPSLPRAPSPELPISQDCAFPAFPMKPKRSQTDKDGRLHKSLSNSRSTRSRTYHHSSNVSNASSVYSTASGPMKRRTSNTSSGQRSRQGTIDDSNSSTSTIPDSPYDSGVPSTHRQQTTEHFQEPPPLMTSQYLSSEPASTTSTMPPTPQWALERGEPSPRILHSPNSEAGWTPTERTIPEEPTREPSMYGQLNHISNKSETFDKILAPNQHNAGNPMFDNPPKEPLYKSKRPPPLLHSQSMPAPDPLMPLSARPAQPPPATSGGLSRTLTNLFGRKRSQSTAAKNMPLPSFDSPRMRALAPEAPERPKRADNLWDDETAVVDEAIVSSPSRSDLRGSIEQQKKPERIQDEVRVNGHKPHTNYSIDAKEAAAFDFKFNGNALIEKEDIAGDVHLDKPAVVPEIVHSDPQETAQDLRRASIDSASSYGSIGFSAKRTASSRSSPPTSQDLGNKLASAFHSHQVSGSEVIRELPERPYLDRQMPESPTDPLLNHGKFSPIPEPESSQWLQTAEPSKLHGRDLLPRIPETMRSDSPKDARPVTPAGIKGQCRGCSTPIYTGQKSVYSADGRLSGKYHKECFVCQTCKEAFATADFYVYDDQPYCGHHYHELNDTLCTGCGNGIEGQYFETCDTSGGSSKKFHPKCLQCTTCKVQLNEDYFEFQGRVYCERDAFRAASSPRSPYDTIPSRPSPLVREVITSGEPWIKGRFPERRTTKLLMT